MLQLDSIFQQPESKEGFSLGVRSALAGYLLCRITSPMLHFSIMSMHCTPLSVVYAKS